MNLLIFGLPLLLGGFSANTYQAINDDVNHVEVVNQVQPKLVSYNDGDYMISLDINELNNYHFNNLKSYLIDYDFDNLSSPFEITYLSNNFIFDEIFESEYISFKNQNNDYISLGDYAGVAGGSTLFGYYTGEFTERGLFTSNIILDCQTDYYSAIKSAIELDIQANEQPHMQPVLTEIVSLLVGGITGIATGIGSGVSNLVSNIFLSDGALSTFGAIIAVFGGIALAIGLSRWVMNFLTSLGAKK